MSVSASAPVVHQVHVQAAQVALVPVLPALAQVAAASGPGVPPVALQVPVLDPTGPPVEAAVAVAPVVARRVLLAAVAVVRSPASRSVRSAQNLN